MSLLLLITFLTFLNAYANRITTLLLKLLRQNSSRNIEDLTSEINIIKKEMNSISMVNEFAKYAKLQRKCNKLTEERKTLAKENAFELGKIKYTMIAVIYGITTLSLAVIVWLNRSEIVTKVDPDFLWPATSFFNWFGNVPGSITTFTWTVISSTASKTIAKHF